MYRASTPVVPLWATSLLQGSGKDNNGRSPSFRASVSGPTPAASVSRPDEGAARATPTTNSNGGESDGSPPSPEPARVVSDLAPAVSDLAQAARTSPIPRRPPFASSKPGGNAAGASKPSVSNSSKIQSLQKQWEHDNPRSPSMPGNLLQSAVANGTATRPSSSSSTESDIPSQLPTVASRRFVRNHPGDDGFRASQRKRSPEDIATGFPSYKRRHTESAAGVEKTSSLLTSIEDELAGDNPIARVREDTHRAPTPTIRAPGNKNAASGTKRPTFITINRKTEPPTSSSESEYDIDDEGDSEEEDEVVDVDDQTALQSQDEGYIADRSAIYTGDQTKEKPPFVNPITITMDGDRPYNMWKNPNGQLESTWGAVLPTGYAPYLNSDHPDRQWVCPVRDCRSLLPSVRKLGAHMNAKHHHATFNDNGDGTLTFVGRYNNSGGRSVPIIVSTEPPDPNELPPVRPSIPEWVSQIQNRSKKHTRRRRTSARKHVSDRGKRAGLDELGDRKSVVADDAATPKLPRTPVIDYLMKHFGPQLQIPDKGAMMGLLHLPRRRDLPPDWGRHYMVTIWGPPAVYSVALYLTGDISKDGPCQVCASGNGVWRQCVVAPKAAPLLRAKCKGTCAGCWFRSNNRRHRNICSFLPESMNGDDPTGPDVLTDAGVDSAAASASAPASASASTPVPASASVAASAAAPSASANAPPPESTGSGRPIRSTRLARLETSNSDVTSVASPRRAPLTSSQKPSWPDSAINPGSSVMSADMLEMEDWEVAPGRIRDETEAAHDNIAFSNSYLTSNRAIPVSNDVSFNVVVLKAGSSTQLAAEDDKMRLCSLATGKVRVRMDGVDDFVIGPNGMFKVRPGAACSVQNRLYIDAVIHMTTITDD